MKKILYLFAGVFCGIAGTVQGQCPVLPYNCSYPGPQPYGYCPGFQDTDSALLTFYINPISLIELADKSIEFSNCAAGIDFLCDDGILGSCVISSFIAGTNEASCETPKKIVGQLDSPMPDCTFLSVELGTPAQSCQPFPVDCFPTPGFCGVNQCLQDISDGLAHDLLTCIYCPFIDCDIDITYVFGATICVQPTTFQRTFTLSFMDHATASECCMAGGGDFPANCPVQCSPPPLTGN